MINPFRSNCSESAPTMSGMTSLPVARAAPMSAATHCEEMTLECSRAEFSLSRAMMPSHAPSFVANRAHPLGAGDQETGVDRDAMAPFLQPPCEEESQFGVPVVLTDVQAAHGALLT
jgi:hypothetical protein